MHLYYIIIKLYNNTTIFSRLLPICVCFRGSAPDPAGGCKRPPPPDPQLGKIVHPEKSVTYFFFSPMTCLLIRWGSVSLPGGELLYFMRKTDWLTAVMLFKLNYSVASN